MKYYVQFLTANEDKTKVVESCGSDGVFILDGRTNLRTMKCGAMSRMYKLRNVSKIDGFKIMKGESFTKSHCVYKWVRSGCLTEHNNRHELQ